MPQRDDFDDDDRPRRRPRDDDDYDRPRRRDEDDDDDRLPPRRKSNTGLVVGILVGVFVLCCGGGGTAIYFFVRGVKKGVEQVTAAVQEVGETAQSQQNLQRIGTAVQQYENAQAALPNNSYQPQPGQQPRPLLSWRVHLLPYLGQNALYQQFKLDEPWDSRNNIRLVNQMPDVYGSPEARKKAGLGKTFYRGFSGPRGIFEGPTANRPNPRLTAANIPDGTSITILIVDAGEAVEWTKPDDIDFSPNKPRPTFGGAYPTLPFALVLMADGTVHQMRKDVPDDTLRKLIDRADGAVIPAGWEANR
jgi:hypothetical protein